MEKLIFIIKWLNSKKIDKIFKVIYLRYNECGDIYDRFFDGTINGLFY